MRQYQGPCASPAVGIRYQSLKWSADFAALPGTSFYRSTWGTASPHDGSYAYAISNHVYGYLKSGAITVSANTNGYLPIGD